ncbi:MAG TPA: hypothetical protein VJA94_18315 [Candidatus Angelobacter sp.]
MNSSTWKEIKSESQWRSLEAQVHGFHDGFIKRLTWDNPDFVDKKNMDLHFEGAPEVRVLIQMQNPEFCQVELLFSDVAKCLISARADATPQCQFDKGQVVAKFLQIENVEAKAFSYRVPNGNESESA